MCLCNASLGQQPPPCVSSRNHCMAIPYSPLGNSRQLTRGPPTKVRCGPATSLQPRLPSHGLHRLLSSLRVRLAIRLSAGSQFTGASNGRSAELDVPTIDNSSRCSSASPQTVRVSATRLSRCSRQCSLGGGGCNTIGRNGQNNVAVCQVHFLHVPVANALSTSMAMDQQNEGSCQGSGVHLHHSQKRKASCTMSPKHANVQLLVGLHQMTVPQGAGGGGIWHKALVVGSVGLWRRLLASGPCTFCYDQPASALLRASALPQASPCLGGCPAGGHEATETGLAYAPVSQAHGHNHIVQCFACCTAA